MSGADRTSDRLDKDAPTEHGPIVNAIETALLFLLGCAYVAERIMRPYQARLPKLRVGIRRTIGYFALFLFAAAPAFYLGMSGVPAFNSPDEANGYTTANLFAEQGRLYFQDELTEMELNGFPIGPRTFVQKNGRGVTQYPLGHPLMAGILHKIFGGAAPLVFAIVPGLIVLTLTFLIRVLAPAAPGYLGLTFIGTAPLWYWISRVYMNLALELLFVAVGLLCFTLALRRRSLVWFFAGSSGFAVAALVRHPEAPLLLIIGLAFMIGMIRCFSPFQWSHVLRVVGAYAIPQILFLLVPVALLSWWTYGTPLTIGYLVLYESHPERLPSEGHWLLVPFKLLKLFFFPNPIEMGVLWNGVRYQIFLMVTVIAGLGIAGFLLARKSLIKTFGYSGVLLLGLGLIYVLVSRADPGVFGASVTEPEIRSSVVRYFMPIYLALGIGTAYALFRTPRIVSLLIITGVVVLSMNQIWNIGPESIPKLKRNLEGQRANYNQILETHTEPEAIVFAAGRSDKHVTLVRRTVGIWSENPNAQEIREVSDVATSLSRLGRPVYLIAPQNGAINIDAVRQGLSTDFLDVESMAPENSSIELLRLSSPLAMASVGRGVYETQVPALADDFAIAIEWDSSTDNHLPNPSFENGVDGWQGPNGLSLVEQSDESSFHGQYSLKFLMGPGTNNEEFARRTYSLEVEELKGKSWLAFGRIMASNLSNAQGEMRVFVKNEDGLTIERHEILVTEDTDGFQTIGVGSDLLAADAAEISLQLGLRGFNQNSTGAIYWDGMELVSGVALPREHCNTGDGGCGWIGASDVTSGRVGDIEEMSIKLDSVAAVNLGGPFYVNDQLIFRDKRVFLKSGKSAEVHLSDLPIGEKSQKLKLQITSTSVPRMRIVPVD